MAEVKKRMTKLEGKRETSSTAELEAERMKMAQLDEEKAALTEASTAPPSPSAIRCSPRLSSWRLASRGRGDPTRNRWANFARNSQPRTRRRKLSRKTGGGKDRTRTVPAEHRACLRRRAVRRPRGG